MAPGSGNLCTLDASSPEAEVARLQQTEKRNDKVEVENHDYRKWQIKWLNIIVIPALHVLGLYGLLFYALQSHYLTKLWALFTGIASAIGITGGTHRLWTHRSYKAKWQMNLILAVLYSTSGMNSPYDWVRDHRVHHKFTDTDADPHNAKRGFFFSHVGWLFVKKHPDVIKQGRKVDMSDIDKELFLPFINRYYWAVRPLMAFALPVAVPCYFWGEPVLTSFLVAGCLRLTGLLNLAWCINSVTHFYGSKPYDKNMIPVDNVIMGYLGLGEGWHNYHHVFPWDYKTGELGNYSTNLTMGFIDLCAMIGWAYDLKTVPPHLVKSRVEKSGDGSHAVWGWGDKEISEEEINTTLN